MPIEAYYKTFYGVHLNHWTESWGGTDYNKLLVKEYLDDDVLTTDTTAASSITFLYPTLIKSSYYLNGKTSGHFKIYNQNSSSTQTLNSYTVTVKKIDNAGTSTNLATHTETISGGYEVPSQTYLALPVFVSLSKAEVNPNEKLAVTFEIDGDSDLVFSHANDSSTNDVMIKLPFAQTSGG